MERQNIRKTAVTLTVFFLTCGSLYAQTGNTGVGTTTPGSKLTVNGSFAATYNNITATTYTLLASDYYVAWNGSSAGTITLPAAISGSGNFSGRVYHIKNTSTSSSLTVAANGSELIDDQSGAGIASTTLPAGYYAMFVSKGATSGTTWEVAIVGSSSTSTPTGADNGLTVGYNSAGKTGLGGTLTKGTDVATGGNNLTFSGTGNVGIGTNAPLTKLHIVGTGYNNIINERNSEDYNGSFYYTYKSRGTNAAPTAIKAGDNIGGVVMLGYTGSGYSTTSNTAFFSRATQNWTPTATGSSIIFQVTANNAVLPTFPMIIDQNGNVGIGTVTPICALHVEPTAAVSYNFPARVYFNSSSATLQSIAAQTAAAPVAAFFDGRIDVSGFIESDASALTLSDIRAKNIIGRTNNAKDLEVLKTIKITDYRLKDITLGTKVHKMVIAQEVEKVYPQAVNISDKPKALPTIYNYPKAVTAAGNTVTFTMNTPHHLNAGDIAIIRFKEKEYKLVVTNCKDPKVFNVDAVGSNLALRADLKDAFIYGTEVKDGREVDYDAIAMLNVSATQELARQVEELKKQNAALAIKVAEVDELKTTLADMRGELNKLAGLKMVKTEQIDNNKNGREQGNSK